MDPLTIASLGIGALQGITGLFQKGKAAKLASSNPRPTYKISQNVLDNQALAESQAGQGLSDAAMQAYTSNNDRSLTASLDAILKGGGSVNNVGDLYDRSQDGIRQLAIIDGQIRANNYRQLMQSNMAVAGEEDKAFQINQYAPYADRAAAAATLQQQGNDNVWKGINTVVGGFVNQQQADLYREATQGVYGTQSQVPGNRNMFTTQGPNNNGGMRPPYVQGNVFGNG